ncbi:hypothetical protein HMPREF1979_02745 [Actinomyces johnsonii F0542]|uniref:Uncharacterized protein n=1 Tax=Actinomyces johnsonii F0542 TaxID=1321818 RepID=U1QKC6_9ACTO|nr:hypothetical protein HMPREF1979_02745 [Actinomyces johnsonii F0542]
MLETTRIELSSIHFGKEFEHCLHVTLTSIRLTFELPTFVTSSSPLTDDRRRLTIRLHLLISSPPRQQ